MDRDQQLRLARRLYDDVGDQIADQPSFTVLLDHALTSIEFDQALGAEADILDPRVSFRAAMESLSAEPEAGPWLYRGAAQAGWVAAQLARGSAGRTVDLTALDDIVRAWLADYPDAYDVDLPRGVLGLGVYALDHPDPVVGANLLDGVLAVLERRVEHDADGVFIRMSAAPEREKDGSAGCRIIGVAHGAAGLCAFLAAALASPLAGETVGGSDRIEALLWPAQQWLLARRVDVEYCVFPHRVELADRPGRATWCSGDPGIGLALEAVGRATGSVEATAAARDVARAILNRTPGQCGIVDACICHGAAGLVWYGSRLIADPQADQARAARFVDTWLDWIADRRAEGPLLYFSPRGMVCDPSFLEGDAGVALVLLNSALGGPAPWQSLLLGQPVQSTRTVRTREPSLSR